MCSFHSRIHTTNLYTYSVDAICRFLVRLPERVSRERSVSTFRRVGTVLWIMLLACVVCILLFQFLWAAVGWSVLASGPGFLHGRKEKSNQNNTWLLPYHHSDASHWSPSRYASRIRILLRSWNTAAKKGEPFLHTRRTINSKERVLGRPCWYSTQFVMGSHTYSRWNAQLVCHIVMRLPWIWTWVRGQIDQQH